jgi:hypothetical protein
MADGCSMRSLLLCLHLRLGQCPRCPQRVGQRTTKIARSDLLAKCQSTLRCKVDTSGNDCRPKLSGPGVLLTKRVRLLGGFKLRPSLTVQWLLGYGKSYTCTFKKLRAGVYTSDPLCPSQFSTARGRSYRRLKDG